VSRPRRAPAPTGSPITYVYSNSQYILSEGADAELARLNMAATAHFEYAENVHYVVHDGKVYITRAPTRCCALAGREPGVRGWRSPGQETRAAPPGPLSWRVKPDEHGA